MKCSAVIRSAAVLAAVSIGIAIAGPAWAAGQFPGPERAGRIAGEAGVTHSLAPAVLSSGGTRIYNANSGLCLEVYHSALDSGSPVDQWTCNGTATQTWNLHFITRTDGDDVYELQNANSGLCLEVYDSQTVNGALVDQWRCNGTRTQHWRVHFLDTGWMQWINDNSGKLLEVYHSSFSNGASVDQWSNNGTATQQWYYY